MYTNTTVKGGVLMVELHLCVKCTRLIVLNDEPYYKKYLPHWQGFAYAHKQCPPSKPDTPFPRLEQ